ESTLGGTFTKTTDVNDLILADLKTRGIVSNDEDAKLQVLTDADLTQEKLSGKLSGLYATKDNFDSLQSTVEKLDGSDSVEGSVAYKLKNAGFAKSADVVAKSDLATEIASSDVQSALSNAGFAKSADVVTKSGLATELASSTAKTALSNAGFAKSTDVVTKTGLATELASSTAKNALSNAGFATKSTITNEVKNDVFTLSDFTNLLRNGGLTVNAAGEVKLADTDTNTSAANLVEKLNTAKANDSSIQTTGITAQTNIALSVANFSSTISTTTDATECNKTAYMFWNTYAADNKGECQKCPDGTKFVGIESTDPAERCVCSDTSTVLTYKDGKYSCVKAEGKTACEKQENTYYNGSSCNKCPTGTYFDPIKRCVCKDASQTFNTSTGQCVNAQAGDCAAKKMFWFAEANKCLECPDEAPFDATIGTCVCKADGLMFNNLKAGCQSCPDGTKSYDETTHMCICGEGMALNAETWKCETSK
ncbi:MAG: hypothetical protein ACLRFI_00660, partial [Alphaproteobacteria bacterium]